MKNAIHPELTATTVTCSNCGTTVETRSTNQSIHVEVCSQCAARAKRARSQSVLA